ncbi:MAG: glycosyltransferase family 4 protein [Candidatus Omnitrophica bacterium]|nr:glycosyltransferase family 4 protein [Candidatus Omnitrophota bacterium]
MKILFLCQYFPPETNAPASRVSELCRCWAQSGEEVTVVTAFPNHPTGIIPPEYRGMRFLREEYFGCRVLRSWIYATPNKGFFKRVLSFLSFMVSSMLVAIFRAGKCDVVIATSPQLFAGLAGWVVSVLKRRPFVLEVRDLWPDSAIQLGVLKNRMLIALSRRLESFLYRRAALLVPVSESIRDAIRSHEVPEERLLVLPNGIDPELFFPGIRSSEKRKEIGIGEEFVVSYIGTHGMAHGLDRIIEAAHLLRDRADIHFLFIGEGAKKEEVVRHARKLGLERITFLSTQPKKEIPAWYAASDLPMVSLLDLPVFTTVLPSKMFEIMACERPILMVAKGECARLLERARAGMVLETNDPARMAAAIEELAGDPERCRRYAEAGRRFVLENFDRRRLADAYLERLKQVAGKGE